MNLVRRQKATLLCAAIALAAAPSANRADEYTQWQIQIAPLGSPPTVLQIDMIDKTFPLNAAPDTKPPVYTGEVVLEQSNDFFQRGKLSATYGDIQAIEHIPLRLYRTPKKAQFAVEHPVPAHCDRADIDQIQQPSADFDLNLQNYYKARALFQAHEGDNICGEQNKKLAAKAWFDRSYALATDSFKTYIDLDQDAAIAVKIYYPSYPDVYIRAVQSYELKIMNNEKKTAQHNGQFQKALFLNQAIFEKLDSDKDVAKLALINEGISQRQIEKDKAFLTALAQ